ncbi:SCO2584 family spore wall biosynthesis protein [Streptomyces cacaoi]|uniref:Uncharacterized protein n=1 Tax=Streptomyces cacaoi TaxID=1898 RepID=A0A4Y3R107_STRCI|nr:hypothetical protein [Streptomyces cacaoi]GEB51192.1 hypothetical protein SCA03_37430 [Streptomyces cacaoi]
MPDEVGGQPFPDGEEPEYRDHGAADEEFASVVFDEDFVRSATVHEPTAAERRLAADRSRADGENGETGAPRIIEDAPGHGPGGDPYGPADEADADAAGSTGTDSADDEGRFDRSDYGGLSGAPGAPGVPGVPGAAAPFPPFDPSAPPVGGYPPELDPAYEHGSDYGYAYGAYGARGRFGGPYGARGRSARPYRGSASWQRPIAWVLAVVMGIGMVALAFVAVYRGAAGHRQEPTPPPATTGVEPSPSPSAAPGSLPPVSAEPRAPTATAEPPG